MTKNIRELSEFTQRVAQEASRRISPRSLKNLRS